MKLGEMADLLDGLVSFLEKVATKGALRDMQELGSCLRQYGDETVSSFASLLTHAREGKPAKKTNGVVDQEIVQQWVGKIQHFLSHRDDYNYSQISTLLLPLGKLKNPEIQAIGQEIGCPLKGRKKGEMLATLQNWLSDIKYSDHQSSIRLTPVGSN